MLYYFILYCTTLYCADRPTQTLGGGGLSYLLQTLRR